MGTLAEDLSAIKTIETGLVNNKVANFAYTDTAYANNTVNGTPTYDPNAQNNIPTADPSVLKVNSTVLQRGWRAQASSITRMLMNHFLGRISYNLNKLNDNMKSLLDTLDSHYGTANGYATLDADGRIPYSQLPESALEYKGDWDASTNTPTLADGTGTLGDMYIVSVAGTQNLGSGSIDFIENDRVIYNGSVWQKLSGGSVRSVNSVTPDGTGNISVSGDDILTTSSASADLQVTLKDKTLVHVYCKGQAREQTKLCLGSVPDTYSAMFLISFDTDNTYQGTDPMQIVFSNGSLAGLVFDVELNGNEAGANNYSLKAGTYMARLVQNSIAPNGKIVAITTGFAVDSALNSFDSYVENFKHYVCDTPASDTVKFVPVFDTEKLRSENYQATVGTRFRVRFVNGFSGDNLKMDIGERTTYSGNKVPYQYYITMNKKTSGVTIRSSIDYIGVVTLKSVLNDCGLIELIPAYNRLASSSYASGATFGAIPLLLQGIQINSQHNYIWFTNGLLVQWGRWTDLPEPNNDHTTVYKRNFALSFDNADYNFFMSRIFWTSDDPLYAGDNNLSVSGGSQAPRHPDGVYITGWHNPVMYLAIGYKSVNKNS